MNGWLLDTDVLSAFTPRRDTIPSGAAAWLDDRTEPLYLSAITAAEIEAGIAKLFEPVLRGGQMLCACSSTVSSLLTRTACCPWISLQQGSPAYSATTPKQPAGIRASPTSRSQRSTRRANWWLL